MALVSSSSKPPGPISTSSAAAVVPPGEVTFCRSVAASSSERCSSSPEPATVSRASRAASSRRQPGGDAGLGHRLRQQEDIGRAGAGHRGDRVHQRLVAHPFDLADGGEQIGGELALARRDFGVGDRDADAAADRRRRVRHGAHDRCAGRQRFLQKADGAPGHDREHQRAPCRHKVQAAAPPRARSAA